MTPELTRVTWSEPSRRERPIQGIFPHSVQKRNLHLKEKMYYRMYSVRNFIPYTALLCISVYFICFTTILTGNLKHSCMNCMFSKWATPSVDAQQWPWADRDLQIWPLSDRHHSDGIFLSDWNHGLSSTGFLHGGEEKAAGIYWFQEAQQEDRELEYMNANAT